MKRRLTLDEAIDRNVELKGELAREGRLMKVAGVKLGIEALKRIKRQRPEGFNFEAVLLPGETEEEK